MQPLKYFGIFPRNRKFFVEKQTISKKGGKKKKRSLAKKAKNGKKIGGNKWVKLINEYSMFIYN